MNIRRFIFNVIIIVSVACLIGACQAECDRKYLVYDNGADQDPTGCSDTAHSEFKYLCNVDGHWTCCANEWCFQVDVDN